LADFIAIKLPIFARFSSHGLGNQLTVQLNDENAPIHTSAPDASSFPMSFLSVCVPEKGLYQSLKWEDFFNHNGAQP
jgi:hypothetical protein